MKFLCKLGLHRWHVHLEMGYAGRWCSWCFTAQSYRDGKYREAGWRQS